MLNYRLVTPPAIEPVSLSDAKLQLRVDISDDDTLIKALIKAARIYAEKYTRRAFYNQTWQLSLDYFPLWTYRNGTLPTRERGAGYWNWNGYWDRLMIQLPRPKLVSVNSISFLDLVGNTVVLDPSTYVVDPNSTPARIVPAFGMSWPVNQIYQPGSVSIEYVAGSYSQTITEQVSVSPVASFVGTLQEQNLGIQSVTDAAGNALSYTAAIVLDDHANPTDKTQMTFATAVPGNVATVKYTAGMCPETIKLAIKLLLSHWYENRADTSETSLKNIPLGVEALLDTEKFESFSFGNN